MDGGWAGRVADSEGRVRTVRARYLLGRMVAVMLSTDKSIELVQKMMSRS